MNRTYPCLAAEQILSSESCRNSSDFRILLCSSLKYIGQDKQNF